MFSRFCSLIIASGLLAATSLFAQTNTSSTNSDADLGLVPKPVEVERKAGFFSLTARTRIIVPGSMVEDANHDAGADAMIEAKNLARWLRVPTGFPLPIPGSSIPFPDTGPSPLDLSSQISLTLDPSLTAKLGAEGYTLSVTPQHVAIRAATTAGLFYGGMTLRQLLPPQIFSKTAVSGIAWNIPCVEITDYPRFAWRGMLLDCARHFKSKAFIEKFLNLMAMQKMNRFQWHFVDSEAWRLEIKKYPKLTQVSQNFPATYPSENPHDKSRKAKYQYGVFHGGGFYTQDDVREIVAYAAARHITIVPDIEFPAHSMAALTAYPQFSTTGKAPKVESNISPDLFNVDDKTLQFLRDVLTEVMDLFPGKYIHFGGDEAPKGQWNASPFIQQKIKSLGLKNADALQGWMFHQMADFIAKRGRRPIGWQEIAEGGFDVLPKDAIIMPWSDMNLGFSAANHGFDIIIASISPNYLDSTQTDNPNEPWAYGKDVTLAAVYGQTFDYSQIAPANRQHVIGAQAECWGELMPEPTDVEYQAFPRSAALAEATWTPLAEKNYADFCRRLAIMAKRWDLLHVNYHPLAQPPLGEWTPELLKKSAGMLEFAVSEPLKPGAHTLHFQYGGGTNGIDIQKVELLANGQVLATDAHAGFAGGHSHGNDYKLIVPASLTANSALQLRVTASGAGGSDSSGEITLAK